jgi:hypothetical protein
MLQLHQWLLWWELRRRRAIRPEIAPLHKGGACMVHDIMLSDVLNTAMFVTLLLPPSLALSGAYAIKHPQQHSFFMSSINLFISSSIHTSLGFTPHSSNT